MSDCGPPCELLSAKQFAFHLEVLKMGFEGGPSSLSECSRIAGYSMKGTEDSISSNATKCNGKSRMQAALAHHRNGQSTDEAELREKAMKLLGEIIVAVDPAASQPRDGIAATAGAAKILGWNAPEKHQLVVADVEAVFEEHSTEWQAFITEQLGLGLEVATAGKLWVAAAMGKRRDAIQKTGAR